MNSPARHREQSEAELNESAVRVTKYDSRGPLAEFRRWVLVACILSILGAIAAAVLDKSLGSYELLGQVLLAGLWVLFAGGEAWVQFERAARRWLWLLSGGLTGAVLFYFINYLFWRNLSYWHALLFLIPAVVEFGTATGVRKRPWVWLIVTPVIYGCIPLWSQPLGHAVRSMMRFVTTSVSFPGAIPSDIPDGTAFLAAILFTRAVVGSFIASRKAA